MWINRQPEDNEVNKGEITIITNDNLFCRGLQFMVVLTMEIVKTAGDRR